MIDTNIECDSQFINGDILDNITHNSDEHTENYTTRVLTMCDGVLYNDNPKVRILLRGLNSTMNAERLMTFPRNVPTTFKRIRHINYCNTMKKEAGTTPKESTSMVL